MIRAMKKVVLSVLGVLTFAPAIWAADAPTPPAPAPAASADTNAAGPKIAFDQAVFDFGKVKAGELVKHSYTFTNTGDAELEVTAVQPSCGCTTAGDWTHKVAAGQTGTIAVQFNSANFNGAVFKTVTVTCNDKANGKPVLQLKGTIWKPIEVNPQFAMINGVNTESGPASSIVRIINNTDEPLTLSPPESNNKSFVATLATNVPGKEYQVTVTTVPPLAAGNVQGQITLKTSSSNLPIASITAWANVGAVISVNPLQLGLGQTPLAYSVTNVVNIQNNSTNAVSLSDASVNATGVDVQIKETAPGHAFIATLVFPQGFEMAQGQAPLELTIKTSNTQSPTLKVPITMAPRPVTATPPIPTAKPPAAGAMNVVPSPAQTASH
jgi:hypothetical protein